jgi:hypothetical protein
MHWPLVLDLGDTIPKDLGDPLPQAWQIAWGGHALALQPLEFFQANQFWPEPDSLAFGDALIGYAPFGLVGDGPHDAVVRYDLLFLFAYALAFLGAYWLARELGLGPWASLVAGAAFAYAPFRLEQDGHMQVISSGGIPLALALAARGIQLRRPGLLFGAWLVAAWQLSLGFAIGLPFAYLLALLVAIGAVIWWRRGRPRLDRRMLVAGAAGALVFLVIAALIARPYFRVEDAHPEASRTAEDVAELSGPLAALLAAPDENWIWAGPTSTFRDEVEWPPEGTLFPGLLIALLAAAGLGSSAFPRWLRIGLGVGVGAITVLALGFELEGGLLWPYRWLYEFFPGWEAIRTPGRLVTFSSLGLALLAAAGAERLAAAASRRVPAGRAAAAGAAVAALLALAIAVEGRGLPFDPFDDQAQPEVDAVPASVADVPDPQLHLPALTAEDNRRYLLWSTDGFPLIVNGRASTRPDSIERLIEEMAPFPDAATVARLREFGVRSVVLHTDRAAASPQAMAVSKATKGLGLRVEQRGPLVIYELGSPSAGSAGSGDSG